MASNTVQEYDDLFKYVHSFGRYQKVVFFASSCLIMLTSVQFATMLFVYGTPNFHCETANITCEPSKCCTNCTSYVFDGPFNSVVSQFNLICDKAYVGATLQACFFAGMLFGSTLSGVLADSIGRFKVIYICVTILVVASVCAVFADCVSLFAVLRFLVGFGAGGNQSVHFTFIMELLGPKYRSFGSTVYQIYFTLGLLIFNLFAYFIRDWKPLILVGSVPGVLLFLFVRVFPESPRWLLNKNQLEKAESVLLKCGGPSLDRSQLKKAIQDVSTAQFSKESINKRRIYTPLDLVRTPKLRRRSGVIAISWFAISFLSNSFFLYIGNLAGSLYLNFFISNAIYPVFIVLTGFLLKRIGHRLTHAAVLFVIGILCLGSIGVQRDKPLTKTWIFVVTSAVSSGAWVTIFLIGSHLFPTVLRSTAVGTGYTIGRVGAILAPYVGILGQLPGLSITLPLTIFGAIAIATGISSFWLPETLNAKMHQTIEEEENSPENYSFPCFGRGEQNGVELNGVSGDEHVTFL